MPRLFEPFLAEAVLLLRPPKDRPLFGQSVLIGEDWWWEVAEKRKV